jgi:hypothetical protein
MHTVNRDHIGHLHKMALMMFWLFNPYSAGDLAMLTAFRANLKNLAFNTH